MGGRRQHSFFLAAIGLGDGNTCESEQFAKYGILLDMLGITIRSNAMGCAAQSFVSKVENRHIFLPHGGFGGYEVDTPANPLDKHVFAPPLPLAIATAEKYGAADSHIGGALVHTLAGYSLRYPAGIVVVDSSNIDDDALSAIVAAFATKHSIELIDVGYADWQSLLTEQLVANGFGKMVEVESDEN